jgi:hypothetical protein
MNRLFDHYLLSAQGRADLGFAWDEWHIHEDYADAVTEFEERLELLSDAACLALTIALAEWIATGLRSYDEDRTIADFVQSAWAAFSHRYSPTYFETDDDDWRGPWRGMLNMTLIVVNDAVFCRDEDPDVADRANQLLFYCQKLYSGLPDFTVWLRESLTRLEARYPYRDGDEPMIDLPATPVVPRETFGPGTPIAVDPSRLVDVYLERIARDNPFLSDAM